MDNASKNIKEWHVFYLYPRTEKKVYADMLGRGYEVFLPLKKEMKVWKNRQRKMIETPLFPGYIFIFTSNVEIYRIIRLPKVVSFVHFGGKPSHISGREINFIKKTTELDKNVTIESHLSIGDEVRIVTGILTGYQGILVKQVGKYKFGIHLAEFNHTVLIDIKMDELEKIKCPIHF
jgi:transcription antitermination factor NusG